MEKYIKAVEAKKMTVAEACAELGISRQTWYNRVSGIENLRKELQEEKRKRQAAERKLWEVKHFFEVEMELTAVRMEEPLNPCYDGVNVGAQNASELKRRHYRFCKRLVDALSEN